MHVGMMPVKDKADEEADVNVVVVAAAEGKRRDRGFLCDLRDFFLTCAEFSRGVSFKELNF